MSSEIKVGASVEFFAEPTGEELVEACWEGGCMGDFGDCDIEFKSDVSESTRRKGTPVCSGALDYFPAALEAVARLSKAGGEKHHPGAPLHWEWGKSADHADCLVRHLMDRGEIDPETGLSHTVSVAWRALALLQTELETADQALHDRCQARRDKAAKGERR